MEWHGELDGWSSTLFAGPKEVHDDNPLGTVEFDNDTMMWNAFNYTKPLPGTNSGCEVLKGFLTMEDAQEALGNAIGNNN